MVMTSRERMVRAFTYGQPDAIPVVYHPSPAGLHVHGEKLLALFQRFPADLPISFDSIPGPAAGTVQADGRYHEIRTDEWGTAWEFRIFGIQGHPKRYPFSTWKEAESYQFPALPVWDAPGLARQKETFLTFGGGVSIFEKLQALRPMDEVLMDIQTEDEDLMKFLDRLMEYWQECIRRQLEAGVDVIMFGDDWGTQSAPILAPALFRSLFKPRYAELMKPIQEAGRRIFFHSCGFLGPVLDELLDLGIHGLWPQIGLFDADPACLRKCVERKVALYIHPDRQRLIPRGTPAEIEVAIRNYAETFHRLGGGGIFYIEIENDAPFENVRALMESVFKYR